MFTITHIKRTQKNTVVHAKGIDEPLVYPNTLIPAHIKVGASLTQEQLEFQELAPATITNISHEGSNVVISIDAGHRPLIIDSNTWLSEPFNTLQVGDDLPNTLVSMKSIKDAWGL